MQVMQDCLLAWVKYLDYIKIPYVRNQGEKKKLILTIFGHQPINLTTQENIYELVSSQDSRPSQREKKYLKKNSKCNGGKN